MICKARGSFPREEGEEEEAEGKGRRLGPGEYRSLIASQRLRRCGKVPELLLGGA